MTQNTTISADQVALIILNYCGIADTLACLKAIWALPERPRQTIVVDNASNDDSMPRLEQWMRENIPDDFSMLKPNGPLPVQSSSPRMACTLLALPENGGYAAGNNAGIRLAMQDPACRAFWILNNDARPEPQALTALCSSLNAAPEAGMAGSTLLFDDTPGTVQCAGGASVNRWLGSTKSLFEFSPSREIFKIPQPLVNAKLDFVTGASMLVRREVFERTGLLPEEYFLYYEDVAFGLRVKKAGFGLIWARDSIVIHKNGESSRRENAEKAPTWVDYLILRNRIYFVRRHFPWALPLALAGYAGVAVNRIRRRQVGRLPLILYALWDGLRGCMGLSARAKKLRSFCRS